METYREMRARHQRDGVDGQLRHKELSEAMRDRDFAIDAFVTEMTEREYHLDIYQGNWDVLRVFADGELEFNEHDNPSLYCDQLGWGHELRRWYREARLKYIDLRIKDGWR